MTKMHMNADLSTKNLNTFNVLFSFCDCAAATKNRFKH